MLAYRSLVPGFLVLVAGVLFFGSPAYACPQGLVCAPGKSCPPEENCVAASEPPPATAPGGESTPTARDEPEGGGIRIEIERGARELLGGAPPLVPSPPRAPLDPGTVSGQIGNIKRALNEDEAPPTPPGPPPVPPSTPPPPLVNPAPTTGKGQAAAVWDPRFGHPVPLPVPPPPEPLLKTQCRFPPCVAGDTPLPGSVEALTHIYPQHVINAVKRVLKADNEYETKAHEFESSPFAHNLENQIDLLTRHYVNNPHARLAWRISRLKAKLNKANRKYTSAALDELLKARYVLFEVYKFPPIIGTSHAYPGGVRHDYYQVTPLFPDDVPSSYRLR